MDRNMVFIGQINEEKHLRVINVSECGESVLAKGVTSFHEKGKRDANDWTRRWIESMCDSHQPFREQSELTMNPFPRNL